LKKTIPNLNFFSQSTKFVLKNKTGVRSWLVKCLKKENKTIAELNFIFCSDDYLLKINNKFLNHNYYTDIITFPTSVDDESKIGGDIFISIDRVRENAKTYGVPLYEELHSVMAHGVLHLCGYGDKTDSEIKVMRKMEERWGEAW